MIRTYVTTIPLQGRFDLAVNQYQSPDNAETLQTRFPIIQVIKNTVTSEDELKIFAIRSVNGDTARNFELFKEELKNIGIDADASVQEMPLPDDQDGKTLVRLCQTLSDAMPEKTRAYVDITYGTKTIPIVELAALACSEATHLELEIGGVFYGEMKRSNGTSTNCAILHDMTALYHLQGLVGGVHDRASAQMLYQEQLWVNNNDQ